MWWPDLIFLIIRPKCQQPVNYKPPGLSVHSPAVSLSVVSLHHITHSHPTELSTVTGKFKQETSASDRQWERFQGISSTPLCVEDSLKVELGIAQPAVNISLTFSSAVLLFCCVNCTNSYTEVPIWKLVFNSCTFVAFISFVTLNCLPYYYITAWTGYDRSTNPSSFSRKEEGI